MDIRQGDVFWVDIGEPTGSAPGYRRPYIIVQNNLLNRSRLNTTVVCALTTNLQWANAPGNVLLNKGEANLSKKSVVNVTQILTIDKGSLLEKIGAITRSRMTEVLEGIDFVFHPREPE